MEAPGVELRRDTGGFERSRAVTTVSSGEATREAVERNGRAGVVMAHAIDTEDLIALLERAARLLHEEPGLAEAIRSAIEVLRRTRTAQWS